MSRAENLAEVRENIAAAAERVGRDVSEVELLAVSKTWPVEAIREVAGSGQKLFGESRLQEAQPKVEELGSGFEWHFIGALQRNKIRKILPLFGTLHGVASLTLAEAVDRIAGELKLKPGVFLEVNLADEDRKKGMSAEELRRDADRIFQLSNLRVLGLMCLPPYHEDSEKSRPFFQRLRNLRDELAAKHGIKLPGLSMGMSGDYEVAIEEGSTLVRVGSAIFGERNYET